MMEVLLLERTGYPGFWQSVTGSQEAQESLWETALREVEEETGIQATVNQLCDWQESRVYAIFPQWRHRYAPGVTYNTEHRFSLCVNRYTPINIQLREHTAYDWRPDIEAAQQCFSPSNREAIEALRARFQSFSNRPYEALSKRERS